MSPLWEFYFVFTSQSHETLLSNIYLQRATNNVTILTTVKFGDLIVLNINCNALLHSYYIHN